jgi:ribosome-binding protein aMBF1 (putative translation factor)
MNATPTDIESAQRKFRLLTTHEDTRTVDSPHMSDHTAWALRRGIRAERARVGLSQQALAARLGWTRSRLAAIELGERRMHADDLPQLCMALGVTLGVLLQMAPEDERRALGV